MSSEAITQNDLREILSRTVGSIPSEYKKLLWTNPSNTFNTGAILNHGELEGYDEVEILAAGFQTSNYVYSRCPIGQDGLIQCWTTSPDYPSNASTFMNSASRHYTTSVSGGITFGNGQMTYGGSAYQNWNSRAVPLKVYGIKYERVAPPQVDASDYVVEQGTEGIWTYRKWDSGIAECWGTWSGSLTHYATVFGGYAYTTSVNYPTSLFVAPPVHTYSAYVGSGFALTGTVTSTYSDMVALYAVSNVSGTSTVYFYISSIGRWK